MLVLRCEFTHLRNKNKNIAFINGCKTRLLLEKYPIQYKKYANILLANIIFAYLHPKW